MNDQLLEQIKNNFPVEQQELVIKELSSIQLHHVMANSEHNVNSARFAILKLSKGSLQDVIKYTDAAKIDFRDVVMWSMQEND